MKQFFLKTASLGLPLALMGLFASANASGAIITINSLLANPGFEAGNQAGGCPVSWSCDGSPLPGFTSFTVTAAQFTAGADGLPAGITPDGTHAATAPTPVEGSGVLTQGGLGTYVAGNTYVYDFWLGTPLTLPADGTTPVGQVGTIRFRFLGDALLSLQATDIAPSPVGQWSLVHMSFTPSGGQVGQSIGVQFFVDSVPVGGGSGNNRVITLDNVSSVPEPATVVMLGLGLSLVGFGNRLRSKRS